MKDSQKIDFEKIIATKNILNTIESSLHNKYFINSIYEIEEYIKNINFIHTNCITNYKESLSTLINNINKVLEEITRLNTTLSKTITYNDHFTKNSTNDNILLKSKIELKDVTKVPLPEDNESITEETTTSSINTIPIGLGIATTGIVASTGAVIYDEYKRKNKNNIILDKFEQVEDTSIEIEDNAEDSDINKMNNEKEIDLKTPAYQAIRNNDNIDKFYGENIEYYED